VTLQMRVLNYAVTVTLMASVNLVNYGSYHVVHYSTALD